MSDADLKRFRAAVFADRGLQETLLYIEDMAEFKRQVLKLAGNLGFDLTADDVEEGIRAGRRAWLERWI